MITIEVRLGVVKKWPEPLLHSTNVSMQGCTNRGRQGAQINKFCTVAPDICGSSLLTLFHVAFLAPRVLMWLLDFIWGRGGYICSLVRVCLRHGTNRLGNHHPVVFIKSVIK